MQECDAGNVMSIKYMLKKDANLGFLRFIDGNRKHSGLMETENILV